MSNLPRITLRPPPHRSFLSGYPGIGASSPSSSASSSDPLLTLPVVHRPAACLSGTVEVRLPVTKGGGGVKARWLRVELEKIESVPSPSGASGQDEGKKREAKYVELIGSGPGTLWEAGKGKEGMIKGGEEEAAQEVVKESPRKGRFKSIVGKKGSGPSRAEEEEEEDGWEAIPEGNYVFSIPLPEGLPPTTEVDSKSNGVSYQLVATLCSRGKKGLLKSSTKPTLTTSQAPVLLLKADILPTWPIYSPLLPLPLPPSLPWENDSGPTIGEIKEARMSVRNSEGVEGEVWMKAVRESGAFGPGDAVQVRVQIGWGGEMSLKLTRLDFVLRETLTFRHPIPGQPNHTQRSTPRITSIFTANASVSSDPDNPTAFAVLYPHEPVSFDLTGIVPSSHSRVTVRTAKYVEVVYHLKVRGMIEGGDELAVDEWSCILGNVGRRESNGLMGDIGWVEDLCNRAGGEPRAFSPEPAHPAIHFAAERSTSPDLPLSAPLIPSPPPAAGNAFSPRFANLDTTRAVSSSDPLPRNDSFSHLDQRGGGGRPDDPYASFTNGRAPEAHHSPPRTDTHSSSYRPTNPSSNGHPPSTPSPAPRPRFMPSPTAAEEKLHLHQAAVQMREEQQARRVAHEEERAKHEEALRRRAFEERESSSPVSHDRRRDTYDSSVSSNVPYGDYEKASLHSAAIVRRQLVQDGLAKPPHLRSVEENGALDSPSPLNIHNDAPAVAQARLAPAPLQRSNTIVAWNGSSVGGANDSEFPGSTPSPPQPDLLAPQPRQQRELHPLARSQTILSGAEAEKRRLFEEAKERARQRQEEARIELEKQSALLAHLEEEEMVRAQEEYEIEKRMQEEEEVRRARALRERDEFERRERERALIIEEEWRKEEQERQRRAREEFEERMRVEEMRRVEELRRLAEQQREVEEESKAEMLRKREERDREEQARRDAAERARLEREEHELAAHRAAEEERLREERAREEAERRQLEDNKRRAYEERLAEEEARRRWEEEQAKRAAQEEAAQRAEEEHRCAEEVYRRRVEQEEARRAAALQQQQQQQQQQRQQQQQKQHQPHQLYDAPVSRDDASLHATRAQPASAQGFDSNRYPSPQGYGQYQTAQHYPGGPPVPSSLGHESQYGRSKGASSLARSPSVNSFAPTTNLNEADVNFYANAIANSAAPLARNSTLSEEKAAYIRRLREADESRRAGLPPSASPHSFRHQQHQPSPLSSPPSVSQNHRGYEQSSPYGGYPQSDYGHGQEAQEHLRVAPSHAYHQQAAASPVESSIGQHWTPTPIGGSSSREYQQPWSPHPPTEVGSAASTQAPAAPPLALPSSSAPTMSALPPVAVSKPYKSAREEKDEAEARRKEHDRARLTAPQTSTVVATAPEEDSLPSYPQGSSSAATPSATEEKGALNAYYSAKAAVEAQQQVARAPPPPPARNGDAPPSSSQQYPLQSIQEGQQSITSTPYSNGNRPSSPPAAVPRPHRDDIISESSSDVHRDPAIAAGKRPVPVHRSVSGSTMADGLLQYPSAPPPLPPQPYHHQYEQGSAPPAGLELYEDGRAEYPSQ